MKKKTLLVGAVVLLSFFLLSGCLQGENVLQSKQDFEDTYAYGVDHNVKPNQVHEILVRPHREMVRFFANAQESEIFTYGDGLRPLIIRAKRNGLLKITLKNDLDAETTLHWHGVRVEHKDDGVPGITQDPVAPGEMYTYNVPLRDPGTYRFHTHIDTMEQMGRGLYGIIIVEDENFPSYDTERIWALKDYRIDESGRLIDQFGTMGQKTHSGYLGNLMTITNVPSPVFEVVPGEVVLIRIVNVSNARIYNLDFSDRDIEVIESDGGRIKFPYKPKILQLGVGERYTLLRRVPQNFTGSRVLWDIYYPRRPNQMLTVKKKTDSSFGSHINNKQDDILYDDNIPDWRILHAQDPDYTIHLGGIGVMGGDKRMGPKGERGRTINNQIRPHSNSLITMKKGEMLTIRLQNNSTRDHPMHLHGDFFQVLGVNGKKRPYVGWKDTVNVPAKGALDLAIIPTNVGKRMFHCHINEHAEFGMMATVDVVE